MKGQNDRWEVGLPGQQPTRDPSWPHAGQLWDLGQGPWERNMWKRRQRLKQEIRYGIAFHPSRLAVGEIGDNLWSDLSGSRKVLSQTVSLCRCPVQNHH